MRLLANQAQEALFTTRDKVVLEGATSNLFTVKDGKVFTPPTDTEYSSGHYKAAGN